MRLGNLKDLQHALGGKVGKKYACAVKKAAGYGGTRHFDVDGVIGWFAVNGKGFKVTSVYPLKASGSPPPRRKKKGRPSLTADKAGARS